MNEETIDVKEWAMNYASLEQLEDIAKAIYSIYAKRESEDTPAPRVQFNTPELIKIELLEWANDRASYFELKELAKVLYSTYKLRESQ